MKQIIITLIILTNPLFAQTDTLNKYNTKGKKHGYWIVYLDANINPVDSANSFYYGYNLYVDGYKFLYFMNDKSKYTRKLEHRGNTPLKGHPVPVNGKYTWYDKKSGALHLIEMYSNGHPQSIEYYSKSSKTDTTVYLRENLNYTRKYKNDFYSYYYRISREDGTNIEERYFRNIENKWRGYAID